MKIIEKKEKIISDVVNIHGANNLFLSKNYTNENDFTLKIYHKNAEAISDKYERIQFPISIIKISSEQQSHLIQFSESLGLKLKEDPLQNRYSKGSESHFELRKRQFSDFLDGDICYARIKQMKNNDLELATFDEFGRGPSKRFLVRMTTSSEINEKNYYDIKQKYFDIFDKVCSEKKIKIFPEKNTPEYNELYWLSEFQYFKEKLDKLDKSLFIREQRGAEKSAFYVFAPSLEVGKVKLDQVAKLVFTHNSDKGILCKIEKICSEFIYYTNSLTKVEIENSKECYDLVQNNVPKATVCNAYNVCESQRLR